MKHGARHQARRRRRARGARPSRSPATPTPASRACSTRSPAPACWSRTRCSPPSTPPRGAARPRTAARYTLTDTVGFVRHLPHQLVEAFRSTLEEVGGRRPARCTSSTGPIRSPEDQIAAVREVLVEICEGDERRAPRAARGQQDRRRRADWRSPSCGAALPGAVFVSARTGEGHRAAARAHGRGAARTRRSSSRSLLPYTEGALVARVHAEGEVLAEEHTGDGTALHARVSEELAASLRRHAVEPAHGPVSAIEGASALAILLLTLLGLAPRHRRGRPAGPVHGRRPGSPRCPGSSTAPGPAGGERQRQPEQVYRLDPPTAPSPGPGRSGSPVATSRTSPEAPTARCGWPTPATTPGTRDTVAVIRLPADGGADRHRLTYPDGPHDAEALLMPGDDRPVIVTKELGGRSGGLPSTAEPPGTRHRADAAAAGRRGRRAGVGHPERGPAAAASGRRLSPGERCPPTGASCALRTYTDAWLYPAVEHARPRTSSRRCAGPPCACRCRTSPRARRSRSPPTAPCSRPARPRSGASRPRCARCRTPWGWWAGHRRAGPDAGAGPGRARRLRPPGPAAHGRRRVAGRGPRRRRRGPGAAPASGRDGSRRTALLAAPRRANSPLARRPGPAAGPRARGPGSPRSHAAETSRTARATVVPAWTASAPSTGDARPPALTASPRVIAAAKPRWCGR